MFQSDVETIAKIGGQQWTGDDRVALLVIQIVTASLRPCDITHSLSGREKGMPASEQTLLLSTLMRTTSQRPEVYASDGQWLFEARECDAITRGDVMPGRSGHARDFCQVACLALLYLIVAEDNERKLEHSTFFSPTSTHRTR
jgi:hypothetical protein